MSDKAEETAQEGRCQHQLTRESEKCRHGFHFGSTCTDCSSACEGCKALYAPAAEGERADVPCPNCGMTYKVAADIRAWKDECVPDPPSPALEARLDEIARETAIKLSTFCAWNAQDWQLVEHEIRRALTTARDTK